MVGAAAWVDCITRYNGPMPLRGDVKRAYQAQWVQRRRAAWIAENGPCIDCGSSTGLEVDHQDPSTKVFDPAQIWSRRKAVRDAELAKCVVRCKPCHDVKSSGERKAAGRPCPSSTAYRNGCRCQPCRDVEAARNRRWRASKVLWQVSESNGSSGLWARRGTFPPHLQGHPTSLPAPSQPCDLCHIVCHAA